MLLRDKKNFMVAAFGIFFVVEIEQKESKNIKSLN